MLEPVEVSWWAGFVNREAARAVLPFVRAPRIVKTWGVLCKTRSRRTRVLPSGPGAGAGPEAEPGTDPETNPVCGKAQWQRPLEPTPDRCSRTLPKLAP